MTATERCRSHKQRPTTPFSPHFDPIVTVPRLLGLQGMLQDLKFAVRTLFRSPGFTATAAATLALGIGVTSLMFSVVNAVLLRPLPYRDQDRLMLVFNANTTDPDVNTIRASALDFEDYRARARSFEAMAGHVGTGFTFTGGGTPELVIGQNVTPDFFGVFGVAPLLGRTFTADEFTPGRENVAVLSHRLWKRRFGAQPAIVGSTVTINGRPFTITGVMPAAFEYPGHRYELWTPLPSARATADAPPRNRDAHYLQVVGRLKANVSREQANSEIAAIAGALAAQYPASNRNLTARATPLVDYTVRAVKEPLYMLLGAVGLVVLIACANVTNLLLARATARHREVAIRQALGAARWRLIRQFLAETAVLYTLGAAGAIALASWGASALVALGPPDIPRLGDTSLDGRVLAATAVLSMITALVFGLVPAVQGAAADPSDALRTGGRTVSAGRGRQRFRTVLVVAEVALSVVLLIGAGLALHSLVRLTNVDPGFDADGQLTFSVVLSPRRYADARSMSAAVDRLVEGLAASPGVEQVGVTTHLPLSGQNMENSFSVDGYTPPAPNQVPVAGMRGVAGDYFAALGARLKSGRAFAATDRADSQPVAIVNETFVRMYFKGQDPVGKRVSEGGYPGWRTVVGVIADVKHSGPAARSQPALLATRTRFHDDLVAWRLFRHSRQGPGNRARVGGAAAGSRHRSGHVTERDAVVGGAGLGRRIGAAIPHGAAGNFRRPRRRPCQHRRLRSALVLRYAADARDRHPRGPRRQRRGHPPHGRRTRSDASRNRPGHRTARGDTADALDADAAVRGQTPGRANPGVRHRRPGARGRAGQLSARAEGAAHRADDGAEPRVSGGRPHERCGSTSPTRESRSRPT